PAHTRPTMYTAFLHYITIRHPHHYYARYFLPFSSSYCVSSPSPSRLLSDDSRRQVHAASRGRKGAGSLRNVVITRLLDIADSFDVDVIEVIGHTDEQPVANHASNLDRYLSSVTLAGTDAAVLQWSDNAGLGLARALAVVKVLASDARLAAFRTLPLSGAQL